MQIIITVGTLLLEGKKFKYTMVCLRSFPHMLALSPDHGDKRAAWGVLFLLLNQYYQKKWQILRYTTVNLLARV